MMFGWWVDKSRLTGKPPEWVVSMEGALSVGAGHAIFAAPVVLNGNDETMADTPVDAPDEGLVADVVGRYAFPSHCPHPGCEHALSSASLRLRAMDILPRHPNLWVTDEARSLTFKVVQPTVLVVAVTQCRGDHPNYNIFFEPNKMLWWASKLDLRDMPEEELSRHEKG